jgi:quercetin dioxygenase-like cupin family protein
MIEVQAVRFDAFGSQGVIINHPIDPAGDQAAPTILRSGGPAHVVTALLEPGGKIGRHPATRPQLLMVISGKLQISGDDGQLLELSAGQAVLFEPGEQHESVASTAVTLAIMEYDSSAH